jgi:hypothetical protein
MPAAARVQVDGDSLQTPSVSQLSEATVPTGTQDSLYLGVSMQFDGQTYEPEFDQPRLTTQMGRVWLALREGHWLTLSELAARVGAPEASVSARLRDLRKERFGNHAVLRRPRGDRKGGLFEYQLVLQGQGQLL